MKYLRHKKMGKLNTDKGYVIVFEDEKLRAITRESLVRATGALLGICEQIRFIYDTVEEADVNPEIKEKFTDQLVDAMIMAKKMQARLIYYRKTYDDKTGSNRANLPRLQGNTARIRMRKKRVI